MRASPGLGVAPGAGGQRGPAAPLPPSRAPRPQGERDGLQLSLSRELRPPEGTPASGTEESTGNGGFGDGPAALGPPGSSRKCSSYTGTEAAVAARGFSHSDLSRISAQLTLVVDPVSGKALAIYR